MSAPGVARLRPRRPERLRHPWIFAGEVVSLDDSVPDGGFARVLDHRGRFFALAYANRRSKIVLRVLSWHDEEPGAPLWGRRINAAVERRGALDENAARRLVNADGDLAPGLVVDRYGPWLAVQLSTLGADAARDGIVGALRAASAPRGIYERSDVSERKLEGLDERTGVLAGDEPPDEVEITEGEVRLIVDIKRGQKTGLFLDQRLNRAAAAAYCAGKRVANCFAYSGGFGAHAAMAGARAVVNVDISGAACALAARVMALNGMPDAQCVEANAFDWLRSASDAEERFDVVILDPPAFARGRSSLESAVRGYKEINLRAIKLLSKDGILVTCSCSRPISPDEFIGIVGAAARDAGRQLQILEERTQPPDHPVLIDAAETSYLKCLIARVIE